MKRILIAAVSIVLLASCTNDDLDVTPIQNAEEYSVEQKTELISSYAQMLAAAIGDPEVRNIIKSEAQLKFDGDYDILTATLHNIYFDMNTFCINFVWLIIYLPASRKTSIRIL